MQHVDLGALISSPEFKFVAATNPGQCAGIVEGILIRVTGAGDGIADNCVAIHLHEWRSDGDIEARVILEAEIPRCRVIEAFTAEKLVPQERKAEDADHRWREGMSLLRYEVLRAERFPDRKSGHAGSGRRERVEASAVVKQVAEIQTVFRREVVIQTNAELVVVIAPNHGRCKGIYAGIRFREEAEEIS